MTPATDQSSETHGGDDEIRLVNLGGKVDADSLFRLYEQQEGDDETPITVRFRLQHDLNKRLDLYLVDRIPFLSRTSLQRLIREESVTVNDRVPKVSTKLHKNDVIVVVLPPPPTSVIQPEDIPLDVLHEDDDLIVLNKAAGIIVHPARGYKTGTLLHALAWHFKYKSKGTLSAVGEEFARPGVVHRLDRNTTGVMLAAKSDTAHWRLAKQFADRTTHKRYLAVVHGEIDTPADTIDLPIGKHPTVKEKYAVRWDSTAKPSTTIYHVREIYDGYSLVELDLKTGRTHQIRVHLSHLGHPIVGDDMYGGHPVRLADVNPRATEHADDIVMGRQALHAALLQFNHPATDVRITMQAPLPADLQNFVRLLRKHRFKRAVKTSGAKIDLDQMISR
ncbi:MAG TPA: RluA family pseudouridine synthase [Phycisphaerales bacterium]|nr:RluA family pseudouridine synthase [Phycisphaerales bacterium]